MKIWAYSLLILMKKMCFDVLLYYFYVYNNWRCTFGCISIIVNAIVTMLIFCIGENYY